MDEPAEPTTQRGSVRDLAEEVFFAGIGAVALTKDRADELVDELARRGRMTRTEAREVVDDAVGRWRGDAARFGERASSGLAGVMRELGLVTRREWEDLDLRLAQVEHRLRLVESERPGAAGPTPPAG
jgi:polyhydroxyalkanoate synthesis regulator phasin